MFQLPFRVDTPLAPLIPLLVILYLLWAYDRDTTFGQALKWLVRRKLAALDPDKAHRIGRGFLVVATLILASFSLFGIAVASGLIRNGDPPRALTMDEFLERHGH